MTEMLEGDYIETGDGQLLRQDDPMIELLHAFTNHVNGFIKMKDDEVMLLRDWMLKQAGWFHPGDFEKIENLAGENIYDIACGVGKTMEGKPFIWQQPEDWPLPEDEDE